MAVLNFYSRTRLVLVSMLLVHLTGRSIIFSSLLLIAEQVIHSICTAQSITDCRRHYTSCVNIENAANEAEVLEVQCSLRNDTIHCLKQAKDDFYCIPLIIQVSSHLSNEIGEFCQLCHRNSTTNCDPTAPPEPIPSPAPSPTPDPTNSPENCSSLPPSYPSSNHNLGAPSLTPPPTSRDCTMPYYKTFHRQQCSAYTLSHIRSFGDRRRSVETCFLPGWWYLLKHQWLEVAVRGEAMHNGRSGNDYTVVSEVRVTFFPNNCSPSMLLYVANTTHLPPTLSPGTYSPFTRLTVENGSLATLLAPWLNTSIVIRRAFGYLMVSLQVPEPLSRASMADGLCSTGCPSHTLSVTHPSALAAGCFSVQQTALIHCVNLYNMMPAKLLKPGSNQACGYDLLNTYDISLLKLHSAYIQDSLLLGDKTDNPVDTPIPPSVPPAHLTLSPSIQEPETDDLPQATQPVISAAHTQTHHHTFPLLLLTSSLLAVWGLR